jgi:hypothetical protein
VGDSELKFKPQYDQKKEEGKLQTTGKSNLLGSKKEKMSI